MKELAEWLRDVARFLEAIIGLTVAVVPLVLVVTVAWDGLAWLTNNQDSWRNTGFRAAGFSLAALLIALLVLLPAGFFFGWASSRLDESAKAAEHKASGDPKTGRPPANTPERYKWANRLPPYDG